jgi:3-hydroxyisobutyrate dehydrogenase-like beta-hydroxyacid dehydrogenase
LLSNTKELKGWSVQLKVGFIGLGQMGKHIAVNLLKSGEDLTVNDLRTDHFPEFVERGARATQETSEIAQADIIFLSLPNSQIVSRVLLGEKGLIHHVASGQIVVDLSTINYSTTLEIAKELGNKGVEFLDAPVSGMEARAIAGTLTVMCGGKRETFDKVMPLFKCMGNNIVYMGDTGSGQLTKLINQLLYDINVAALAEILPMSVKMGLDPEKVGQVVNNGTGRSHASEFFIPKILEGNFKEAYPLKEAYKDLVSAAEIGAHQGIPMPVLAAATNTYQMALLKGYGDRDKGGMIGVYEDLLGVYFRKSL